jgi:hypothetical protein
MGEEYRDGAASPHKLISRTFGLMSHPLELAAFPPNDIAIDPLQGRTHLHLTEVTVVDNPAADARIVRLGQLLRCASVLSPSWI